MADAVGGPTGPIGPTGVNPIGESKPDEGQLFTQLADLMIHDHWDATTVGQLKTLLAEAKNSSSPALQHLTQWINNLSSSEFQEINPLDTVLKSSDDNAAIANYMNSPNEPFMRASLLTLSESLRTYCGGKEGIANAQNNPHQQNLLIGWAEYCAANMANRSVVGKNNGLELIAEIPSKLKVSTSFITSNATSQFQKILESFQPDDNTSHRNAPISNDNAWTLLTTGDKQGYLAQAIWPDNLNNTNLAFFKEVSDYFR